MQGRDQLKTVYDLFPLLEIAACSKLAESTRLVCGMAALYCCCTKSFIATDKTGKDFCYLFYILLFNFKEMFMSPKAKKINQIF